MVQKETLESNCLGSSPVLFTYWASDPRQVTCHLSAVALFYKMGMVLVLTSLGCHEDEGYLHVRAGYMGLV